LDARLRGFDVSSGELPDSLRPAPTVLGAAIIM
jgi:hypothetical protein